MIEWANKKIEAVEAEYEELQEKLDRTIETYDNNSEGPEWSFLARE